MQTFSSSTDNFRPKAEFVYDTSFDYEKVLYAQITPASVQPAQGSPKSRSRKALGAVRNAMSAMGFDFEQNCFKGNSIRNYPIPLPPVLHVAGTKGKGSTCCFVESILRHSGLKTGLFTSPHLVHITERFRIDGKPIQEEILSQYVQEVVSILKQNDLFKDLGFFRLITVIAFYVYACEAVDVLVLETGLGGRLDATNIIMDKPINAVTLLDYDHTEFLGETIEEIADQKAGIFRENAINLTIPQVSNAMEILKLNASNLEIITVEDEIATKFNIERLKLGIAGEHQKINAALAIKMCWYFLGDKLKHEAVVKGLARTFHPARSQVYTPKNFSNLRFLLDGAHTAKSMEAAVKWLTTVESSDIQKPLILVFNCAHTKDTKTLLLSVIHSGLKYERVYFTKPHSFKPVAKELPSVSAVLNQNLDHNPEEKLTWQQTVCRVWSVLRSEKPVNYPELLIDDKNISQTINDIKNTYGGAEKPQIDIFVTGSLLLVGDALKEIGFDWAKEQDLLDKEA